MTTASENPICQDVSPPSSWRDEPRLRKRQDTLRPKKDNENSTERDSLKSIARLRLAHRDEWKESYKPPTKAPVPWSVIVPTARRERAIEGLIYGCGVGEAIASLYSGPSRVLLRRKLARQPLSIWSPGNIYPGPRTHTMLMAIQAVLESRASADDFARTLRSRMVWYQRAHPLAHATSHAAKLVWNRDALSVRTGDDPLARAIAMSVLLQGNDNFAVRWILRSTVVSHPDSRVANMSILVANAAQSAQLHGTESALAPQEVMERLSETTSLPSIQNDLEQMNRWLSKSFSLSLVASKLNNRRGIQPNLVTDGLLGMYAWLRYPNDYRTCIEKVVRLGGDTRGVASIAGALAGTQHGVRAIPKEWIERVTFYPYDPEWREHLIERVRDWPHGAEDIQNASALPIYPFGQLARNALSTLKSLAYSVLKTTKFGLPF